MNRTITLGQTVMTQGIASLMAQGHNADILDCLTRHSRGDWGTVDTEDRAANDRAADSGEERILSVYLIGRTKIWIITEWDRSYTTILLPNEY